MEKIIIECPDCVDLSLKKQILLVKEDIQRRFPNCSNTVIIYMWDDDTTSVECRYGTIEKLHISKYYNGELTYEEVDIKFVNNTMIGGDGTIYYPRTK